MKLIQKFQSPDTKQNLTLSAVTGRKGGINIKVTMKGVGKGVARATTGCRATYTTDKDAQASFDKLSKEIQGRGWTAQVARTRNAFMTIPEAPKAAKTPAKPAVVLKQTSAPSATV